MDKNARWVEGEELQLFIEENKVPGKREFWIRNEFNLIYPGEFTPPKVAEQCRAITGQGLRKMENDDNAKPRHATLLALAEFYQIPIDVFISDKPERFFLGKPKTEFKYSDIRGPHYKMNVEISLERPDGEIEIYKLVDTLPVRHLDFEQFCDFILNMEKSIQNGIKKQQQMDKAYDTLKGLGNDQV